MMFKQRVRQNFVSYSKRAAPILLAAKVLKILILLLAAGSIFACSSPTIDLDSVEPLMRKVMDRHDSLVDANSILTLEERDALMLAIDADDSINSLQKQHYRSFLEAHKPYTASESADYKRSTQILRNNFAAQRAQKIPIKSEK